MYWSRPPGQGIPLTNEFTNGWGDTLAKAGNVSSNAKRFCALLSNPAFSPNALSVTDAKSLLESNLTHPTHRFWADEIGLAQAVEIFGPRVTGHPQFSDAYLLGLAIHKKGKLATIDRAIVKLLPEKSAEHERIVLV